MGRIRLTGATSGYTELRAANAAGNNTIILPTTNGGEVIVSDSSGNVNIDSGTFYVDASNNRVGVGTTSPSTKLHVAGSGQQILRIQDTGNTNGFDLGNNTTESFISTADNKPITFYTNNLERAKIDSSGRVGIGTSVPQGLVSLSKGTGNTAPTTVTAANSFINIGISEYGAASNGKYMVSYGYSSGATNAPAYIGLEQTSTGSYTCGDLTFYTRSVTTDTAPTERLRITNAGNVGIGTTSVNSDLHVYDGAGDAEIRITSNAANQAILRFGNTVDQTLGSIRFDSPTDSLQFYGLNDAERFRCDSSGRLLVGTSSSAGTDSIVQVSSTGAGSRSKQEFFHWEAADGGPDLTFSKSRGSTFGSYTVVNSGDSLGAIYFRGSNGSAFGYGVSVKAEADGSWGSGDHPARLVFSTTADGASSPTERCRIDSTGSFLVGTSNISPATGAGIKLRFNPNNLLETQISAVVDSNNGATSHLHVYNLNATNNGYRFYVNSNGGIANFQANNVNLSDRSTKKDISPASATWDCIKKWEIVNYRYKDQPDDSDLSLGVIAQQVAESCPEVITVFKGATEDEPQKLGIKEQQMYWMAIKALQEAQVRIEALEAEVAALKAQ